METRAGYVLVGGFVIALFVAAVAGAILLGDIRLDQETRSFRVYFSGSVSGLGAGAPVRYRGVPVGSVGTIRIDPEDIERIEVLIEVDSEVPVKTDMIASLESQGLTGIGYIEIDGGSQDALDLVPGPDGEPPIIPSQASTLQQVFETAPEIADQLIMLMGRAQTFLTPENERAFSDLLVNLATVTGALADNADDIERAILTTADAATDVRNATQEILPLVQLLVKEVELVSEEAKLTLSTIRGTTAGLDGEIVSLSRSLAASSNRVNSAISDVQTLVNAMSPGLRDFSETGLYELTQFLVEARVLVGNLDQLTRQLNRDPTQFLFGDQEGQVEAQ